jgi:hypothetical protein
MTSTYKTGDAQSQTTDLLTSSSSTCPFTIAEIKDMQSLVAEVKAHHRESSNDRGYTRGGSSLSNVIDVGARTMLCELRASI